MRSLQASSDPPNLQTAVWLGAVSFEERCVASAADVGRRRVGLQAAYVVEYPTKAGSKKADTEKRRTHSKKIEAALRQAGTTGQRRVLNPYRLSDFRNLLDECSSQIEPGRYNGLIIDITCLTRLHVLALAGWLKSGGATHAVWICYVTPQQYGAPERHRTRRGRWLNVLVAPCRYEPRAWSDDSMGIVLLGHEGARTSLAIKQCEPSKALVILSTNSRRRLLEVVSRVANAALITDIRRGARQGWALAELPALDVMRVQEEVRSYLRDNKVQRVETYLPENLEGMTRVVLYPFGPKPTVLAAALAAMELGQERVWYSYPIPALYDLDYTMGIGSVKWFQSRPTKP